MLSFHSISYGHPGVCQAHLYFTDQNIHSLTKRDHISGIFKINILWIPTLRLVVIPLIIMSTDFEITFKFNTNFQA